MRIVASLLAIALAVCFSVTLTGCGGDKKTPDKVADKKAFGVEKDTVELELKKDEKKFKGEVTFKLKDGKEITAVEGSTDEMKATFKGLDVTVTWAKDDLNDVKEAKLVIKGKNGEGEAKEAKVTVKSKKAA